MALNHNDITPPFFKNYPGGLSKVDRSFHFGGVPGGVLVSPTVFFRGVVSKGTLTRADVDLIILSKSASFMLW